MMDVLREGGPAAQLAFVLGMVGILATVLACGIWYRRRDLRAAALKAVARAQKDNLRPLEPDRLFQAGRTAALAAAQPPSGWVLMSAIMLWLLAMVAMTLAALLRQPDAMVLAEVIRGSLDLPPQLSRQVYFGMVSRALVAGSMATLMVVPAALVGALALGFLRCWLMGGPLDRALLVLIAAVETTGEDPRLAELKADLAGCTHRRWTVTGWLTGPIWFFIKGRYRRGWALLTLLILGTALAFAVWWIPARLIWGGEPLISGTTAGTVWHHLREPLMVVFTLPVWIYTGVRGNRP